ncbi:hypothetical protein JYU34_018859 [Plutella xylostella]|uniref:BZIP domain-containing protein n=1 Tax=Plutella xylostella TaxID=51655 RepID=A0ABQ7PYX6_PLUXY|nr:transcription factor kayak isoform X3 [Plutella xylostella]KAG7298089.1 hypothetical protein JYU34_018859 [Plutella xylostella]
MSQLVPYNCEQDDSLMFATMFDYQHDGDEGTGKSILASFEGLNSGVPTRTTATITPTQLRSLEQTYIELNSCREQQQHAGFVPPAVAHANTHYGILNQVGYGDAGGAGPAALHVSPGPMSSDNSCSTSPGLPTPKRRNMGGRRPTKTPHDISPEEEERRKVRRERNKMAAARCRKRRLDHTNELQDETDKLENTKQRLQDELRNLHDQRERLQAILQNHLGCCPLAGKRAVSPPDVKPFQEEYPIPYPEDGVRVKVEVMEPAGPVMNADPVLGLDNDIIFASPTPDKRIMLSAANPAVVTSSGGSLDTPPALARPNRPNFLHVPLPVNPAQIHNSKAQGGNKIAGVEISTPSNGIPFNFESLMEGGTGLTPVHPHPHCAAQQQRSALEVTTPDAHNNSNLVSL